MGIQVGQIHPWGRFSDFSRIKPELNLLLNLYVCKLIWVESTFNCALPSYTRFTIRREQCCNIRNKHSEYDHPLRLMFHWCCVWHGDGVCVSMCMYMQNAPVLKDVWDQKRPLGLVKAVLCHSEHSHLMLPAFWNFCPYCLYCKAVPESHTSCSYFLA